MLVWEERHIPGTLPPRVSYYVLRHAERGARVRSKCGRERDALLTANVYRQGHLPRILEGDAGRPSIAAASALHPSGNSYPPHEAGEAQKEKASRVSASH